MIRVFDRRNAGPKNPVVTSLFLFAPQPIYREPGERVVPVQRPGELRQKLGQEITALHVSQLVEQYGLHSIKRPFGRVGG